MVTASTLVEVILGWLVCHHLPATDACGISTRPALQLLVCLACTLGTTATRLLAYVLAPPECAALVLTSSAFPVLFGAPECCRLFGLDLVASLLPMVLLLLLASSLKTSSLFLMYFTRDAC